MDMRLRIPDLMPPSMTRYELAKRSGGRISMSTAYRLVKLKGRVQNFDADMLEALCDIFEVGPGDLFERTKPPVSSPPKRKGRR